MAVNDRLREIAANIAENPDPRLVRTLIFESHVDPSANNEGPQLQQDMQNLGLKVTFVSDAQFQGGAGGSSITVNYTYDPEANISENLRANIANESKRIADQKAQSPTIIRNHIQNLIEANPSNSKSWEISLNPSDNPKYLLEYLGKNCPEGSFGYRETNVNNEHKQVISVDKSNQIFSDLALLEKKLSTDKAKLSPTQQKEQAADKFAENIVKQITGELATQIKGSKGTSVWNVQLQQPITNPDVQAAIERGLNKVFPGLKPMHAIISPPSGTMSGRNVSNFTFSPTSKALTDKNFISLLPEKPTPPSERSSATTSMVLSSNASQAISSPALSQAPSAAPQPQMTSKAVGYFEDLLKSVTNKDNEGYKKTMAQMQADTNFDKSDVPMKVLNKNVSSETQKNTLITELLKDLISEAKTNAAPSPGSTTSSQESSSSTSFMPSLKLSK